MKYNFGYQSFYVKLFNWFFALTFFVFAALQYNDPDPYLWIPIYGAMVAVCVTINFRPVNPYIYFALAVLFIIYAGLLFPSVMYWLKQENRSMLFDELAKMQNLYIEETREFFGLMICLSVLGINYFVQRKRSSH